MVYFLGSTRWPILGLLRHFCPFGFMLYYFFSSSCWIHLMSVKRNRLLDFARLVVKLTWRAVAPMSFLARYFSMHFKKHRMQVLCQPPCTKQIKRAVCQYRFGYVHSIFVRSTRRAPSVVNRSLQLFLYFKFGGSSIVHARRIAYTLLSTRR